MQQLSDLISALPYCPPFYHPPSPPILTHAQSTVQCVNMHRIGVHRKGTEKKKRDYNKCI